MSTSRTLLLGSVAVVLAGALAYDWTRDDGSAVQAVQAVRPAAQPATQQTASASGVTAPPLAVQYTPSMPQTTPTPSPPPGVSTTVDQAQVQTQAPASQSDSSGGPPGSAQNTGGAPPSAPSPQATAAATNIPIGPPGWKPDLPTNENSASGSGPGTAPPSTTPSGPEAPTASAAAAAPAAPQSSPQEPGGQAPAAASSATPGGPVAATATPGNPGQDRPTSGNPAPAISNPGISNPGIATPGSPTQSGPGFATAPIQRAQPSGQPRRPKPHQQSLAGIHPLAGLDANELTATRERPLFESSRRPLIVQQVVVPETKPQPVQAVVQPATSGLRLVGVITSDDKRTALLTPGSGGKTFRVDSGDTVEGWTVEQIKLDSVVLQRQGKRDTIRMQRDAGQKK